MSFQSDETVKVNKIVGKSPGIGWLPAVQMPFWIIAFCISGFLYVFFNIGLEAFLFWGFLPCIIFWGLTGNKPHRFLEQFHSPRLWVSGQPRCQFHPQHPLPIKERIGKRVRVRLDTMKIQVSHPLEDSLSLVGYGEVRLGDTCGFYLLSDKQQQVFRVVFAWKSPGIDPNLPEESAKKLIDALDDSFRELPSEIVLRFEYSSFAVDDDYQTVLDKQLEQSTSELSDLLIYSQKARTRQLRDRGKRQIQQLRIFAIYETSLSKESYEKHDWLGRMGQALQPYWEIFKGEKERADFDRYQKMITEAYSRCFRRIDSLLDSMGLAANAIGAWDLYETDYRELHNEPPPPFPQLLVLDRRGLHCHKDPHNANKHVSAVLFRPERGRSVVPESERDWIHYPLKRKYLGFMQLGKPASFPSDAHRNKYRGELRYLFDPTLRAHLHDFKIVTEISRGNQGLQKWDLERHTRNANELSLRAMTDKTVDVASENRAAESISARQALEQGKGLAG
ncbi:MAG: hypothetical protein MUD14_14920 [Hydrococcus sp. Prado102]|jgi:hypothetical protein|nr:hypothetical protein [Hydrococcus sp. Prado102]